MIKQILKIIAFLTAVLLSAMALHRFYEDDRYAQGRIDTWKACGEMINNSRPGPAPDVVVIERGEAR